MASFVVVSSKNGYQRQFCPREQCCRTSPALFDSFQNFERLQDLKLKCPLTHTIKWFKFELDCAILSGQTHQVTIIGTA